MENLPCEWSGLSEQACDSDGGRLGCLSLGGGAGRGHAPGGCHTTRSASGLRGQDPRSQENAEAPAGRPSWLPALRGAALGRAWLGRVGTVPEFQAFGNGAAAGTGGGGPRPSNHIPEPSLLTQPVRSAAHETCRPGGQQEAVERFEEEKSVSQPALRTETLLKSSQPGLSSPLQICLRFWVSGGLARAGNRHAFRAFIQLANIYSAPPMGRAGPGLLPPPPPPPLPPHHMLASKTDGPEPLRSPCPRAGRQKRSRKRVKR